MNSPLLSICIPTYNRAQYLDDSLLNIGLQFDKNQELIEKVEVVVSDNASPDNTADIVHKYQKKYKNIKYFRNNTNLGPDKNYINSVLKAGGEYGWIIGDDDLIVKGGLDFVVDFLTKNKILMLTVNSRTYINKDDSNKIMMEINGNLLHFSSSANNFFKDGYCVGILGTIIFNREIWVNTDREGYRRGWSYYEIALKMLAQSKITSAHLNYPLVIVREDCDWVNNGTELFTFLGWKQFLAQLPKYGYDKKITNSELAKFPNRLFTILLRAKGHDLNCSLANYKLIFSEFKKYPFRLFLASIIFLIPNEIIKKIRDFNKKFIKIKI